MILLNIQSLWDCDQGFENRKDLVDGDAEGIQCF